MPFGNRGFLSQLGNLSQVTNALVEEVSTRNNTTGTVLISYVELSPGGGSFVTSLQLNVDRNTVILNPTGGGCGCLRDIREGMWVDALFSSRMTRSIPPQSNAFLIVVRRGLPAPSDSTTARILSVNPRQRFLMTGSPTNINSQMRFNLTNNTFIRDRQGNPISIEGLRPGQTVRIIHANFQTASIPPQTTAFYIQVL